MSDENWNPVAPLSFVALVARLAVIGGVVFLFAAAFAYTGGWLTPQRLTPHRFVDVFQQAFGLHPGFRRNHAKGVCITGSFASNGAGVRWSKALVFEPGTTPVEGRFALAGGDPFQSDAAAKVRSLALRFLLSDGEEWRTGMNNIPVFPVNTPQGFFDQLAAAVPDPETGKPDPAKMKAFLAAHPETARALALIKARPISSGFADASYNSLDAFRFKNAAGGSTPVRWAMVSAQPFSPAGPALAADKNYLFDALIAAVEHAPLRWHLIVTIGQPGDPTDDATIPWPDSREKVDVGTLTIDTIETEADGNCRDINFDPLVLPAGIKGSDDPLLSARSSVYSRSFTRRSGEAKTPSAVQVAAHKEAGQ